VIFCGGFAFCYMLPLSCSCGPVAKILSLFHSSQHKFDDREFPTLKQCISTVDLTHSPLPLLLSCSLQVSTGAELRANARPPAQMPLTTPAVLPFGVVKEAAPLPVPPSVHRKPQRVAGSRTRSRTQSKLREEEAPKARPGEERREDNAPRAACVGSAAGAPAAGGLADGRLDPRRPPAADPRLGQGHVSRASGGGLDSTAAAAAAAAAVAAKERTLDTKIPADVRLGQGQVSGGGLDSTAAAAAVKERILDGAGDLESLLAYVRSGRVQ
jgi:hypothetical protein